MAGKGRWLEWLSGRKITRLCFEAETSAAARAVIAEGDRTGFPHIEVTYVIKSKAEDTRSGEQIDEVRVYMDLAAASKLTQEMISAIQASTPRIPGPAYRIPFD